MAGISITVEHLERRYKLSSEALDDECSNEHIREIALLMEEWELLASHLGLSKQKIEAIKVNNHSEEVKREAVLTRWKEAFAFMATYRVLLEALLKIQRADLACGVCKLVAPQHGPQQTASPHKLVPTPDHTVRKQQQPAYPDYKSHQSNIDSNPGLNISSPGFRDAGHNLALIDEIEKAFSEVVIKVEESFEKRVPLVKLQRYSCHLPASLKGQFGRLFEDRISRIWNAKTVGELFGILSYFWDYLHPNLLLYLVGRFGIQETIDTLSEYEDKLTNFRKKIKIPDYIGERRINLDEDDYTPIIAILGDEWSEKTLADLEEVRRSFSKKFSFLQLLPKMNGLRYNSIAVIFSLPKFVDIKHEELLDFFQFYNVLKLVVGSVCVYEDESYQVQASAITEYQDPVELRSVEYEEEILIKHEKADDDSEQQESIAKSHQESGEPGGFTCQFVEQPPKGVQSECPVCLQVLHEPHQVECCGYSFCRVCIERIKSDNKPCPTCNETSFTCFRDKRLQRSLYDYEVYCTHKEDGCDWIGELGQLEKHLNANPQPDKELEGCLFTHVSCRFKTFSCNVKPCRGDMPEHLKGHSQIHLELLQKSDSSVNAAFVEDQQQISKLSQQNLCVNKTLSSMKEIHEREISQLNREMRLKTEQYEEQNVKHKEEILQLNMTLNRVTLEYEYLRNQSLMKEQYEQQLVDANVMHERKISQLNTALSRMTEEYKRLQSQIRSQPLPSSSQVSVGQTSDPVLGIGTPTPPVTFTMTNFDVLKRDNDEWYSPPFYTHHHGYKMCLSIVPNGHLDTDYHGTHVSVYINMKRGEFDDNLKWPFRGEIDITLLDQEDNENHDSGSIPFDDNTPDHVAGRVTVGTTAVGGSGLFNFIPHSDLQPRYLKNNCLMFQIHHVRID